MKAWLIPFAIIAICLSACSKAPENEVQAARTALAAARKLGAEQSAPAQLSQSSRLLDSALQEIEKQSKSLVGQDYETARKLLIEAAATAQEAGMRAAASGNPAAKAIDTLAAKDSASAKKPDSTAKDSAIASKQPDSEVLAELPTLEAVESRVNKAYGLYQKARQADKSANGAAEQEKAMVDLKAAQAAIKVGDFAHAMRFAAQAESRLAGAKAPAPAKP